MYLDKRIVMIDFNIYINFTANFNFQLLYIYIKHVYTIFKFTFKFKQTKFVLELRSNKDQREDFEFR